MNYQNDYNNYQIPLRLNSKLAGELEYASKITCIQKSKLLRMGLSRIITDIKANGLAESMSKLSKEYEEIA